MSSRLLSLLVLSFAAGLSGLAAVDEPTTEPNANTTGDTLADSSAFDGQSASNCKNKEPVEKKPDPTHGPGKGPGVTSGTTSCDDTGCFNGSAESLPNTEVLSENDGNGPGAGISRTMDIPSNLGSQGSSGGGMRADTLSLTSAVQFQDAGLPHYRSGLTPGCTTCGDGTYAMQAVAQTRVGVPDISRGRSLHPRQMALPASFGPGQFADFDIRLTFQQIGNERFADLFDPKLMGSRRYIDGAYNHPSIKHIDNPHDGVFTNDLNQSAKSLVLKNGAGQTVTEVADASTALLTTFDGNTVEFEIINLAQGGLQPGGQDVNLAFGEGSGTSSANLGNAGGQATLSGVTWTTSPQGSALSLSGAASAVTLPTYQGVGGGNARTLSAWIKPASAAEMAIMAWGSDAAGQKWVMRTHDDGVYGSRLRVEVNGGYIIGEAALADGEWHHVAAVLPDVVNPNVTAIQLYVDGQLQQIAEAQTQAISTDATTGLPLTIGNDHQNRAFTGEIDEVQIYNRALSIGEVQALSQVDAIYAGRVVSMKDRNGYGTTIDYQYQATDDLQGSPSRLWQVNAITDANDATTTITYKPQQVAGHWVVDTMVLPDGNNVSYDYGTNGMLESVTHADGGFSTFSYTYDNASQTTKIHIVDGSGTLGQNEVDLAVSNAVNIYANSAADEREVVPQAAGQIRSVRNGEGEVVFAAIPNGDGFNTYVYEGAGIMRRVSSLFKDQYATSWSLKNDSGTYNSVKFTGESNSVAYDYNTSNGFIAWYQRNAKAGIDKTGRKVKYVHDANGRIEKATHPDNTYETWARNEFNQVVRYRDRDGRWTKYEYDARGNKVKETRGFKVVNGSDELQDETGVWEWTYYEAGHPNQFLLQYSYDANGNRTDYLYDDKQRLETVISPPDVPNGPRAEVHFTYDAGGRIETMKDPVGRVTTFSYTDGGRLDAIEYQDGSTESVVISDGAGTVPAGLVTTYTDRNGNSMVCDYDDAGRRTSCETAGPDEVVLRSERTAYVDGSALVAWRQVDDMVTWFTYDYRGREASRTVFPQIDPTDPIDPATPGALTTSVTYVKNRVDTQTDAYGRRTFYLYNREDMVDRTVRETLPGAIAAGTDLRALTRDLSPNADYLITDRKYDLQTHDLLQTTDGRGIIDTFAYDIRSRLEYQVLSAKVLNAGSNTSATTIGDKTVARRTEFDYDAQGNVTDIRHPRFFDPDDPQGKNACQDKIAYTGRNLRASRTEAFDHPDDEATESWTYHLDGRVATATDFKGNTTTYLYHPCCGRLLAVIDPLGNGRITHTDYHGNITHTAVVENLPLTVPGYTWRNPVDENTLNETTTRYDARHRPTYRTVWREPLGEVNPNGDAVPIAGLGSYAASMGLTTRFLYDDDLSDGLEFAGLIPYTIDITGLQSGSARGVINPEGEISIQLTDGLGRALRSYNGEGHLISTVTYDAISDGTEVTDNGTTVTAGLLMTAATQPIITDAVLVNSTTTSYSDGAGRTRFVKDAEGHFSEATFDANNNRKTIRDGNGVGADCDFDLADREITCTDTAGDATGTAYNAAGQAIVATDGRGKNTVSTHDVRGRKVTVVDRLQGVTRFAYDDNSNLESIMDADADPGNIIDGGGGGETTEYRYDERNLLVFESFPGHLGGETAVPGTPGYDARTYTYDGARRLVSRVDQLGEATIYEYDRANRLEFRRYPDGKDDSFTYDGASRLLTAVSQRYANTVTRDYLADGALDYETLTTNGRDYTVSYAYDSANRWTDLTYPSGRVASRTYTKRHQINAVAFGEQTTPTSQKTVVGETTYDAGRRLDLRNYGNGLTLDREWRTDNLADTITVFNPTTGAVITDFKYFYDANKRKTEERDLAPEMAAYTQTFGYDDEDRLTAWARPGQPGVTQTWNLTKVGDWKDTTKDGVFIDHGHNPVHETTSYAVEGAPAMPGPSHDAKGNMTTNPARGQTYAWDFENWMTSATDDSGTFNATYNYDALGRRVSKTVDDVIHIFVCAGAQVIAEYESSLDPDSPDFEYVYGAYVDELLVMSRLDATHFYYHANHLYSIAALSDETGSVVERYAYDASGECEILIPAGAPNVGADLDPIDASVVGNVYGFTGRRLDDETGLWFFRVRYLCSQMGTFVSRDPLGYIDGLSTYRAYFIPGSIDPFGLSNDLIVIYDGDDDGSGEGGADGDDFERAANQVRDANRVRRPTQMVDIGGMDREEIAEAIADAAENVRDDGSRPGVLVFDHGDAGLQEFGDSSPTSEDPIWDAMPDGANVTLFGCNVGSGNDGAAALSDIAVTNNLIVTAYSGPTEFGYGAFWLTWGWSPTGGWVTAYPDGTIRWWSGRVHKRNLDDEVDQVAVLRRNRLRRELERETACPEDP